MKMLWTESLDLVNETQCVIVAYKRGQDFTPGVSLQDDEFVTLKRQLAKDVNVNSCAYTSPD